MKNCPNLQKQSKTKNAASRKKTFFSSSKIRRTFGRFIGCGAASLFSLGALALLPSHTAFGSVNVLYYVDGSLRTDQMAAALASLPSQYSVTTVTSDSNFATQIQTGNYQVGILAIQENFAASSLLSALGTFVANGGRAIYCNWYTYNTLGASFDAAYSGATNSASFTITDSNLASLMGGTSVTLTNPGWGTYSTGFTVLTGGTSLGSFGTGDSAIVAGNNGRTLINGFLTDTVSSSLLFASEIQLLTGLTTEYWSGSASGLWTAQNWAEDVTGSAAWVLPLSFTNVIFSANGAANQNTTLGADFTINSLSVNDPFAVTIGGTNTLTVGSITINAGAGFTTISSNLVLSGSAGLVTVDNTAGMLISGAISGTNALTKSGTGTLTLTGSNSYTGATNVSQGTLVLGDGITVNTGIASTSDLNVASGASLVVNLTASNPLALGGTLTNNGSTTFAGASSAGNVSIVNNAAVNFQDTATADSSIINASGQASYVRFSDSATAASSTIIASGFGSEAYFSGSSTAGGSTINATGDQSNVCFDGSSTAGSSTITLSGNQSFVYFGSSSTAGSSTITLSGNQSFVYFGSSSTAGSSTITLSGSSNMVGFTNSSSGGNAAVTLADASSVLIFYSGSASGNTLGSLAGSGTTVLGSETVTIGSNNQTTTYSGVICDSISDYSITGTNSSLVKTGTGTFNLTGTASYTGPTVIQQGSFLVNGVVTGNVTVQGGLLGGSGYIGGNVVNSSVVSPGNSPGTLTIAGDYTQTASGTLYIQIASPTLYDQLIVGGVATIAGALKVDFLNGFTPSLGQTYTFLAAASGVSGTFTSIDTNTMVNLVYTGTSANLMEAVATQGLFADLSGLTPNEHAVAAGLDKVAGNSRVSKLVSYLDSIPKAQVPGKLEKIVPTDLLPVFDAIINSTQVQDSNLERRMSELQAGATGVSTSGLSLTDGRGGQTYQPDGKRIIKPDGKTAHEPTPLSDAWGFFVNGSGEFVNVGSTAQALGSDFTTAGVSAGADYRLGQNAAVGLMAGYANTTADGSHERDAVKLDAGKLALYATAFSDGFFLNGAFGGGMASYDTRRKTLGGYAYGSPDGTDINAMLGTGYTYRRGGWSLGPIGAVRYSMVMLDGYTEHGSLAPLTYGDQSESSMRSTLGGQIAYAIKCGKTTTVTPQLRVQWQHEYLDPSRGLGASFLPNGEGAFTVHGPDTGRDSALIDAGVSVKWTPAVSVYGFYTGDIGRANYTSHAVNAGVQLSF